MDTDEKKGSNNYSTFCLHDSDLLRERKVFRWKIDFLTGVTNLTLHSIIKTVSIIT